MAGNIPTYSSQIAVPDVVQQPRAQFNDTGLGEVGRAAQGLAEMLDVRQEAQRKAAVQDARVKAVTGLDQLTQSLQRDPDYATALQRYDDGVNELRTSVGAGIEGEANIHDFSNDFDLLAGSKRVALGDTVFTRERDDHVATLDQSLNDFAAKAAAASNAHEHAAIVMMAGKNIDDMANAGYITKQDAVRRATGFNSDVDETSALQLISDDPRAAVHMLGDPDLFRNLDPQKRIRLKMSAEEQVRGLQRDAEARAHEAGAIGRANLSDAMDVIRAGLPVSPDLLRGAAAAAVASGDAALAGRVNEVQNLAIWQDAARKATPIQLQSELGQLEAEANAKGADASAATKLNIGRQILTNMNGELQRDPLSWAQRQGVSVVTSLSFTGGASEAALAQRGAEARQVSGYYGVAPKYFTDEERVHLKQTLADAPAQTQLALAKSMVTGFGRDAPRALGEISTDAPVFAHLAGLMAMGPQYAATAEAGFSGAKAMADKADVVPSGATLDGVVSNVMGTSLDERQARTRTAAVEAAKAIYTSEALRRGLTSATFDHDLFAQSLQKALGQWQSGGDERGGVAAINGQDVILPSAMSQSDLRDTVGHMSDAALAALSQRGGKPVHGDGTAFTAAELADAYLVTVGPGQYQISVTDPSKGRELVMDDKSHGYYVLDLSDAGHVAAAGIKPQTRWQRARERMLGVVDPFGQPVQPGGDK